MKNRVWFSAFFVATIAVAACAPAVLAVDFESFDFNDAAGTTLSGAVNTANPGNFWFEDTGMAPSDVRNNAYNIVKQSTALESNYLQIDNIASGTRYLVARMSGWEFFQNDPSEPNEEFRLAFLDNDTGNSGQTITAQMNIRRDANSENIVVEATALGAAGSGATNIPGAPILNNTQSAPFTLVMELNKTANSYKVFYKDGTNPSQVVGLGSVDPARGGNSLRMAVNNNFGNFSDDYPLEFFEVFSVDRIAISDTNPLTDLISLEIDRTNATMTLRNTSGATITGIESYSITSTSGSLNPAGWNAGSATPTTSTNEELAAAFGAPISLTNGGTLPLSTGAGAWLKSPFEDLQMVLNLTGGVTRTVNVNFLQNGGEKWMRGDFSLNNSLDAADWLLFIANAETDLAGLSRVEAYQKGDLDGDGTNSIADFVQFKTLYDTFNGGGSFDAMIASLHVPEPGSLVLLGMAAALMMPRRRRRGRVRSPASERLDDKTTYDSSTAGDFKMPLVNRLLPSLIVVAAVTTAIPSAKALILEDFPFNDANGTTLDAAVNSVNASNSWALSGNSWEPSVVNNGSFRITKASTNLSNAHLDIANVTTGKVWLVAELAGWNFAATPSAPSEEVRFAFIDNNDAVPPTGSTITAQMDIGRSGSAMALFGRGALGTGATNVTGNYPLPLVRTDPFTMVLELDKDADQYSVYYKDGSAPFAQLGTAASLGDSTLNPGKRDGNIIRFAPTGSFSDPGEFFDISRVYLTDTSPIGEVDPTALTLEVKSNGQVAIRNDTSTSISFNAYTITFGNEATQDLNFAEWNSLSDQGIDAVGGGNDPGETWDEAGGSNDHVLAERFLLGSSTIGPGDAPLQLGSAFRPGGDHEDLVFQYFDTITGTIVPGEIDFVVAAGVNGDYNNDGTVDAADYVIWRKNVGTSNVLPNDPDGGTIGTAQYNTWKANFGESAGGGSDEAAGVVPEPQSWWLAALAALLATAGQQWTPRRRAPCYVPAKRR